MEKENPTEETEENQQEETQEETLESLKSKLQVSEEALKVASPWQEKYKELQRTDAKKDTKLREGVEILNKFEKLEGMVKILATAQMQGLTVQDDDLDNAATKAKQPDIMKMYEEIERKAEAKNNQDRMTAAQDSYKNDAESVLGEIVTKGYEKGTDEYEEIYDILDSGFDRLNLRALDKARRAVGKLKETKPKEESKESEQEKLDKLVEEKARQMLIDKGSWKAEDTKPSGSAKLGIEEVRQKMKDPKWCLANSDEIDRLMKEGKFS